MSTKLAWVRCFPSDWVSEASGMTSHQISTYMMLTLLMYKKRQPILENASILARISGCSVKAFNKALDFLLSDERLIRLEDGRLWSLQVEEELNNSNENLNKFSERAQKAAKARWDKNTKDACNIKHDTKHDACNIKHDAKHDACDAITNNTNNTNIYKKNNTIVLSKKEIEFEDLETTDLIEASLEVDAIESQSDQNATSSENQPLIHEQASVLKRAKRVKADRGCRLPADFEPDYDFALTEGLPPERVKVEIAKFRDFWNAKAGKDASKRDWQATWRNWVRNSKDNPKNKQGGNYGNYTQKQKSIGERIADSILDIGNRGYFEAHSQDDSPGLSIDFERWQPINETAGSDCFRGW
ncbi:DUF1376 domain-containing protein [Bartonella rattimassiliensis]|uniref:Uncharacterized protein n=1 Tax=Bartonella rattimassiliensis 15908 TaxID=1094556 RepID=J1JHE0_9HYPH|nr:DUF1376 domain-containing protein [Bartonella rattimassiliensis]EJF83595.1 hypothetical protein MCY_01179 [Bartonella rattimassiliensis 15908]